jgi:hypothetical protein
MARFSQWKPYGRFVQSGLVDGEFLNASFTLLASGPPRLASVGTGAFTSPAVRGKLDEIVFPIGIVQNFSLAHNRQFNRIWEIGSERSFFISGRTVGQVGLSRVLYHGPSLLRVMYAYYQDLIPPTVIPSVIGENNLGALTVANMHDVKIPPGYKNLFFNLASDLFNQPVGMMAYFRDSNENTVGSVYLESCYIPNHAISTDSQGTIMQENIALQFERAVPVAVEALGLIGLDASDQEILGFGS